VERVVRPPTKRAQTFNQAAPDRTAPDAGAWVPDCTFEETELIATMTSAGPFSVRRVFARLAMLAIAAVVSMGGLAIATQPAAAATYQQGYAQGEKDGRSDGYKDGYADAYKKSFRATLENRRGFQRSDDGFIRGYKAGYEDGYETGFRSGKRDGRKDGRNDAKDWRDRTREEMRERCRRGLC
jgi:flagellar biosynthesis/type III secretory pathway protein FliH